MTDRIRASAAWYLSILGVGFVIGRFTGYLWPGQPVLKGQPANVLVFFAAFVLALAAWLLLAQRLRAPRLLMAFLIGMAVAWIAGIAVYRLHGDSFNYTALLFVPILALIAIKPPSAREAWQAVVAFGWATAVVLVVTRMLEMAGVIAVKSQSPGIIAFDEERYWLPLNDLLGIAGRWPGPFEHNGDTAMMGALLIVIAIAHWTRSSWAFIPVGVLTLLVTSGRASAGAAAAGLVLVFMFSRGPWVSRIPRWLRVSGGVVALALGALALFSGKAGVTGRDTIWPAFIDLWRTSPLTGVGGSGIAVSGGITEKFGHAHSIYLDNLARNGLVYTLIIFGVLAFGVFIAARAAGVGAPGPLAVLVAYFITGVTEVRNDWIHPTVTGFLVLLMVVTASAELTQRKSERAPTR